MASSFNIPLTTLPPGSYSFPATGGRAVADTDTTGVLSIDRTVAGGLNSVSAAVDVQLAVFQSDDGGATWFELGGGDMAGGPVTGKFANTAQVEVWFAAGTGRLARAGVVVSGGSVAVQGTLTTQ